MAKRLSNRNILKISFKKYERPIVSLQIQLISNNYDEFNGYINIIYDLSCLITITT